MKEPQVRVGILSAPQIKFDLPTPYLMWGDYSSGVVTYHKIVSGPQTVSYEYGKILWNGRKFEHLRFEPVDESAFFELKDVTIGIGFHWERKENQRFQGVLKFVPDNGKLIAVNVIRVEEYLTSVISSEMSANASLELLKAHAVISRSWVLSQSCLSPGPSPVERGTDTPGDGLRWYNRDSHHLFDVCADDHCQRYQGITRASTDLVKQAVAATRGQVLQYGGKICDARYSKCCGGALEEFQYCWEDTPHPYLRKQRDFRVFHPNSCDLSSEAIRSGNALPELPDLTDEQEATRWIRTTPPAFCHTTDKRILSQVLNHYDQETTDFYRWKVEYTQNELSALIKERSGIDYGQIVDLIPVARGTSGRIWKLKIVGTRRTLTIGKELEIRRTLSASHLYSSAFVVEKEGSLPVEEAADEAVATTVPARFVLIGAGWGHGVGLCQIGAAVMGEQGYKYDAILLHYYNGASIVSLYE
ncbi:MAG: SpoIID/LytB domain-containing protein [Bacteroides sp.]|nr:SpoIID/LytB domain-containing protein [Bacteroides sp.]